MSDVKRRRYVSPLRAEQGAAGRAAVIAAAHRLFVAQGYGATTVEQIATAAGVSKPTVFSTVGNKVEVFMAVRDVAMAGDDEDRSVTQRPSVSAIAEATGLADAIGATARHLVQINVRYRRLDAVLRGAAGTDTAMRALMETAEAQRHTGAGHLLQRMRAHGTLAVDEAQAQDRLWLLMAPDTCARLVDQRGWHPDDYRDWLVDEIGALFAPSA